MKREIIDVKGHKVCDCCPGHDQFPNDTYKNNRSVRARSRDIKREHRFVRRKVKLNLHGSDLVEASL